jgi:hypothetical protein
MSEENAPAPSETENTESSADTVASMVSGRPDNVPEKFWDAENNSVRTDDVIKSYTELESRFGSFTGAPEEYAFTPSDDVKTAFEEKGIEIDVSNDPLYEAAVEFAKNTNLNQEGFEQLTNLYLMQQLADVKAAEDMRAEAINEIGQKRIDNLSLWGEKNLTPELFKGYQDMITSAETVKAMEHLVAMTRNAPVSDSEANTAPGFTESELKDMQFATDEFGNRKINSDPEFRAEYNRRLKEFYGDAENRVIVG